MIEAAVFWGGHRYDTAPELLLLSEIWQLRSQLTNYFYRLALSRSGGYVAVQVVSAVAHGGQSDVDGNRGVGNFRAARRAWTALVSRSV